MAEEDKKKYAPILPYDVTLNDNFQYYDRANYICNRDKIAEYRLKETSNITKFYEYKMNEEDESIGGQDK